MADINTGARWHLDADASGVVKGYQQAQAAQQAADKSAQQGAAASTAGYGKLAEQATKTGEAIAKGSQTATQANRTLADSIQQIDTRLQQARDRANQFKATFASLSATGAAGFMNGQQAGFTGLAQNIYGAGGLRNYALMAGGPLGVAAAGAGAAYGLTNYYAGLGDAAQKARVTAQEMEGLRATLEKVGVTTQQTDAIAAKMAETWEGTSVRTVNAFADAIRQIQAATTQEDKLRIATQAVGQELAGPLVQAADSAKGHFGDLAEAARLAGSSFTNDLARGAKAAIGVLSDLGAQADGTYAQVKRLMGVAGDADKLRAAEQDVRMARARMTSSSAPADLLAGNMPDNRGDDQVAADVLAAQGRLEKLREQQGLPSSTDELSKRAAGLGFGQDALGNLYGTRTDAPMQGPPAPAAADLADLGGGGGGRRGRGGGGRGGGGGDDSAQQVLDKLAKQLELAQAMGPAHEAVVEKQKIEAELAQAGVTAESKTGQLIAERVRAIDAATEAQKKYNDEQEAQKASAKEVAGEVKNAATSLLQAAIHGKDLKETFAGIAESLASKELSKLLDGLIGGGDNGGGLLGGLLGGIGGSAAADPLGGGGLLGLLTGALGSLFHDGGGSIPANGVGIVGEFGPEVVRGPASVTSRRDTAAMLNRSRPNVQIINHAAGVMVTPYVTGDQMQLHVEHTVNTKLNVYNAGIASHVDTARMRQP